MVSKSVTRTILFLRIYFIFYSVASVCLTLYFGFFSFVMMMGGMTSGDEEGVFLSVMFMLFALLPVIMLALNAIAAFRVNIRSNNNWIFMVVLVCFGFTNPYTILPSIFMLISLMDDEVKEYYKESEMDLDEVKVV